MRFVAREHVARGRRRVTFSLHATDKVSSHFPRSPFTHPPFRASPAFPFFLLPFFLPSLFLSFTTNEFRRSKQRKTGRTNFPFFLRDPAFLEKYLQPFLSVLSVSQPNSCLQPRLVPRSIPVWFHQSVYLLILVDDIGIPVVFASSLLWNFVNRRFAGDTYIYVLSKLNWTKGGGREENASRFYSFLKTLKRSFAKFLHVVLVE